MLLFSNLPASLAGLFAMACLVTWPLARSRHGILVFQLGIGLGCALHYGLLGFTAAAALNVVGIAQVIAAAYAGRSVAAQRIGEGLIYVGVAAGFVFWTGFESALAIIATLLIFIARLERIEADMRILLMCGGAVWLLHDLYIGSPIAAAADVVSLGIGVYGLYRMYQRLRGTA